MLKFYDYSKGIFGNIITLFAESNATNQKVIDNQVETDEMMLDHEERLILLEVGE